MKKLFMNDKSFEPSSNIKNIGQKEGRAFDQLQLYDYAKTLQIFIRNCETPMTIGLQGDWGIGKTTLLNMVRVEMIEKHPIIDFNTWQYSLFGQDEYLGLSAVNAMLNLIKENFGSLIKNDSSDIWNNASKKVQTVLKSVKFNLGPVTLDTSNLVEKEKSHIPFDDISEVMKNLKNDFQLLVNEIIKNSKKTSSPYEKIVFFIDDIDRVKPVKALELLESLKNFFDVDKCVFVLAVDYEVVQLGMAEKLGVDLQKTSGKSFFDKIINLPFSMPTQSYSLDKYIKQLFVENELASKEDKRGSLKDADWKQMSEISSVTIGKNPRSIKRAVNYMYVQKILRDNGNITKIAKNFKISINFIKDVKLRWSLVCLQIAWPELFSYFVKNPSVETINNLEDWEFLDSLSDMKKMYERVTDKDGLKSDISDFFDILYDILDENDDGKIGHDELKPLLTIMAYLKMTEIKLLETEPPYLEFTKNLKNNFRYENRNEIIMFLEIFEQSHWYQNRQVAIRRSTSKKFISFIFGRKRIATLVSMSKHPFKFRIGVDDELLVRDLKRNPLKLDKADNGDNGSNKLFLDYEEFIIDYNGSQTGWGDTEVDVMQFFKKFPIKNPLNQRLFRKFLNQIFQHLTNKG
tara:strand:+ start:301 stop:2193 length:1893 start_codon:yes stop_codon:yes gene_type:complete